MVENLTSKIMIMTVLIFFVMPSLSPAQELSKQYEVDENIEFNATNNISPLYRINTIRSGEVHVGEKLDPADYGPGIIEHMDDAIARDLLQQSNSNVDLKVDNIQHGIWVVPSRGASYYPHSGLHNVINKWGDTKMGIAFPTKVDIQGAWFAGQGGGEGVWASSIRVTGYRNGEQTQTTDWFEDIDDIPTWFTINLQDVDRIVIEATPVFNGAGWYAMDDLTYVLKTETGKKQPSTVVLDFEDCNFHQELTDSNYADLIWETGTGDFYIDQDGVPAPQKSPNADEEELSELDGYSNDSRDNGRATAPALISNFQGVIRGDAGSWSYPPDTCGAAGPNHFVEVVNRNFAVYDKATGAELINILLGSFLPGSNGDPRVLYDQHSNRWIVIVSDFNSRIYLAVSTSSDPTGSWFKTNFVAAQGSDAGKWPDYPTLGVDADGIYVAAYMVGGSYKMSIFALYKAPLIASSPSLGAVIAFRELPWEGAIQPVHTFGTPAGEYFVSRMSSTKIRVRLLTNLLAIPILTELGDVTIPSHYSPPDAPALGSTTPLDTVGHRLMNAVYRDGYIWTTHCISVGGRAASRWYKISALGPSLADYGTVSDSVMHYFFPSIIANAAGDVVMGFSGSHSGQYAAAYYTGRLANDSPGVMASPVLLKAGEASYNLIDGYGRNRWGDYSLCSLDPTNEQTLWTIQEYAHSHTGGGDDRWGTWIGELDYGDRAPPIPNPLTWEIPPTPISTSEITMNATEASDNTPPIEYFFFSWESGTNGANSSGWQTLRTYNDSGLVANTEYTYSVQARDSAVPPNSGIYSSPALTATHIETPIGLTFGTITSDSIQVTATGTFTNLNVSQSGLFFEMIPTGGSGANVWVQTPTITVTGLNPGTQYCFRVKARNRNIIETAFTNQECVQTLSPLFTLDGECTYQDATPVDPLAVKVTNLDAGEIWDASIVANYYSLDLTVGIDISVDDVLRIIAKDGERWINVTDHIVTQSEINNGGATENLILDEYYLDLIDFPMYLSNESDFFNYSQLCGPAVAQMNLNYMWWNSSENPGGVPTPGQFDDQEYLFNYSAAGEQYMDADAMHATIQELDPSFYNFGIYQNTNYDDIIADICYWIDYDVPGVDPGYPGHVPGAVPAYGDYSNWMSIRGIHTNHSVYGNPEALTVHGFWVNDPLPSGIGENTYKMASNWLSTYYLALNVPGDPYDTKYVAVCEPPENAVSDIELVETTQYWDIQLPDPNGGSNFLNQIFNHLIIYAATNGARDRVCPYDEQFEDIFDQSYPGQPMLVKNLVVGDEKHDFYIVPYDNVPTSFMKKGGHQQGEDEKTLAAVIVNAETGQFQEASWVDQPVKYLKISESDARQIVYDTLVNMGIEPDDLSVRAIQTDLVYRGGYSQFSPEWRVIIDELGLEFFVSQDGTIRN